MLRTASLMALITVSLLSTSALGQARHLALARRGQCRFRVKGVVVRLPRLLLIVAAVIQQQGIRKFGKTDMVL